MRVNTLPGEAIRVAGALLRCDKAAQERVQDCGKHPPAGESRGLPWEIFKICIPGDAFWCIFSDKKCFFVGTVHLN